MPEEISVQHHVFVDFENVQDIDLDAIGALPVFVTLFIGKHQTKVATTLLEQVHRHAPKVRIVRLGSAGHNALDMLIARHIGRAELEYAGAELHIISKDHDFDPLIAHLHTNELAVSRSTTFAALPFLPGKKRVKARSGAKAAMPAPTPVAQTADALSPEKLEKLAQRLRDRPENRPKSRKSLLHHINAAGGHKLSEKGQIAVLEELTRRKELIVESEKVRYRDDAAGSQG
jgi:hypothetical protein